MSALDYVLDEFYQDNMGTQFEKDNQWHQKASLELSQLRWDLAQLRSEREQMIKEINDLNLQAYKKELAEDRNDMGFKTENARLQKEMEEAKQVIILLKFDCEELSKQEFPNVLTSIEMAIAFLAKYDGTFRQPEGGVK